MFDADRGELKSWRSSAKSEYSFQYDGKTLHGLPHGVGTVVTEAGSVYEGEWSAGEYHGSGIYKFSNGDVYSGEIQAGTKHGFGTLVTSSATYEGNWKCDMPHGFGTYVGTSGLKYCGEWVNGVLQGPGKLVYPDGASYDGQFHNDEKCGSGKFQYVDGATFEGQWDHDVGTGQGVFRSKKYKYSGQWLHGRKHGVGTYTYQDKTTYDGTWKENTKHGHGSIKFADGASYVGSWANDCAHGYGRFKVEGKTFEGFWNRGKLSGQGEITSKPETGEAFCGPTLQSSERPLGSGSASIELDAKEAKIVDYWRPEWSPDTGKYKSVIEDVPNLLANSRVHVAEAPSPIVTPRIGTYTTGAPPGIRFGIPRQVTSPGYFLDGSPPLTEHVFSPGASPAPTPGRSHVLGDVPFLGSGMEGPPTIPFKTHHYTTHATPNHGMSQVVPNGHPVDYRVHHTHEHWHHHVVRDDRMAPSTTSERVVTRILDPREAMHRDENQANSPPGSVLGSHNMHPTSIRPEYRYEGVSSKPDVYRDGSIIRTSDGIPYIPATHSETPYTGLRTDAYSSTRIEPGYASRVERPMGQASMMRMFDGQAHMTHTPITRLDGHSHVTRLDTAGEGSPAPGRLDGSVPFRRLDGNNIMRHENVTQVHSWDPTATYSRVENQTPREARIGDPRIDRRYERVPVRHYSGILPTQHHVPFIYS